MTSNASVNPSVPAHTQRTTIHLLETIQEHAPRDNDPHYHLFMAAKRRIAAAGLMRCAIPDCTFPGPMELHHSRCEYSEQGGVDLVKFNAYYGLHLADEEEFKCYIEGEGNLEVLCPTHHRTHLGVHVLPGPFWDVLRVWKSGIPPPAEAVFPSDAAQPSPDAP